MNMLPFLKSFLEDIRDFSLVQVLSFFHWSKSLLYVSESGLRGVFNCTYAQINILFQYSICGIQAGRYFLLLSRSAYFKGAKHWLAKAQFAVTKWILQSKLCLLITISTIQLNLKRASLSSHIFRLRLSDIFKISLISKL